MESFLVKEEVNTGRQKELDLSKAIAIVLMVFCHVGLYFFNENSGSYLLTDFLGGEFAAPVFMVCLGIGTLYAKHNEPKDLLKRGLITLLFGYILNFIRAGVPTIVGMIINVPSTFGTFLNAVMAIDIMQFAGLAFMVLALFKKLKLTGLQQLFIGILCAGVGEILAWTSTGVDIFDFIFGLIWGTNTSSFFPLLNWIAFPTFGVFFGEMLLHCNDKNKFYKSLFLIGLFGVILAYYQMFTIGYDYYNNQSYYFMGIKNVIFAICFPITSFSICNFLVNKTKISNLKIVEFSSKNLNSIYCISWVLIMWTDYIINDVCKLTLSEWFIYLLMPIILIASYLIVKLNIFLQNKIKNKKLLKEAKN